MMRFAYKVSIEFLREKVKEVLFYPSPWGLHSFA
jgi:hypothetical protein